MYLSDEQESRYLQCLTPARMARLAQRKADAAAGRPIESGKVFVGYFLPEARCVRDDKYTDHWKIVDFDGLQLGELSKSSRDAWGSVTTALFKVHKTMQPAQAQ